LYLVSPVQYQEDYVNCSFTCIEFLKSQKNDYTNVLYQIYEKLYKENLLDEHLEEILNYCDLLLQRKQFSKAEAIYSITEKLDRKISQNKYLLYLKKHGDSCMELEQYLDAIEYYRRINEFEVGEVDNFQLELVKDGYSKALNCLAIDNFEKNQFEKAQHSLNSSLSIKPNNSVTKSLSKLLESKLKSSQRDEKEGSGCIAMILVLFMITIPIVFMIGIQEGKQSQKRLNPIPQESPSPKQSKVN
jgi:tetratricopeptide (TPR) repeat protein